MPATGFLGTRADVFVDVAMVFFAAAPFLMGRALRLAAQRRQAIGQGAGAICYLVAAPPLFIHHGNKYIPWRKPVLIGQYTSPCTAAPMR